MGLIRQLTGVFDVTIRSLSGLKRGQTSYFLFPLVGYLVLFLFVPILFLVRMSLNEQTHGAAYQNAITYENYTEILTSTFIHDIIQFTLLYASITTLLVICFSFPYAYVIWRVKWRVKIILLAVLVLQLLTAFVTKLFAWILLLSPEGVVNTYLVPGSDPLMLMPGFRGAVISQTYVLIPFATLAIYSILVTIDWKEVEAARDLGASRPRSIVEIVLPQAVPGIAAGAVISFSWTVGSFAAPTLLGSTRERTLAIEVTDIMIREFNWPFGGALAIVIIVLAVTLMVIIFGALHKAGWRFDLS